MNIVIGSAFRNAKNHVRRYLNQVKALERHAGPEHHIRVVAVEGDSIDRTYESLLWVALELDVDIKVVKCEHGQPWFGSTEDPKRMAALSVVGNAIFDEVNSKDDVLLYVESDLLWDPHGVGSLIDRALRQDYGFDVFAPMVMAGPYFYDIWAFRRNGERFAPHHPFHSELRSDVMEIDSAGSCLAMRTEVAMNCRIRDENCLVGWCADARKKGYRIAVDPAFKVEHPR